jgi:hypothetical protein
MNPRIIFEALIIGLFVVGGLFWLNRRETANADEWHKATIAAKADVKTKTVIQQHFDTVYATTRAGYVEYRDRILHDTVIPPTIREKEIIAHTDTIVAACDSMQKADTSLIAALRHELKLAENPPGAPRLGYYAEGLYDFVQREPVARLGATMRVFGPLDLSAAVSGQRGVKPQALVGVRVRF